jgi:hypothetical protein
VSARALEHPEQHAELWLGCARFGITPWNPLLAPGCERPRVYERAQAGRRHQPQRIEDSSEPANRLSEPFVHTRRTYVKGSRAPEAVHHESVAQT